MGALLKTSKTSADDGAASLAIASSWLLGFAPSASFRRTLRGESSLKIEQQAARIGQVRIGLEEP